MIRPVQTVDCGAIEAIEAQTFNTAFDCNRLLNLLKMPVFCGFVDDLGEPPTPNLSDKLNNLDNPSNLAGYILATVISDEAEILSIAVSSDHQKCKRGAQLLGHFLTHIAAQDVKTVLLEVAADNIPALKLYYRHGFTEFGRRTAYYRRSGGDCDAIMMRRLCS